MDDIVFYNGKTILSKNDINGNKPEIYIVCSNRSVGKTFYFSKYLLDSFFEKNMRFVLLARWKYELSALHEQVFAHSKQNFYPEYQIVSKSYEKGSFYEIKIKKGKEKATEKNVCGYSIAINNADNIRKFSHLINADHMFFDEFQPESGIYAPKEIEKFISLHTSLARGISQPVKYLPVYMTSNLITVSNPYFKALGFSLPKNPPHIIRGNGFVVEYYKNKGIADKQRESPFMQAFSNSKYLQYAVGESALSDNSDFIDKPQKVTYLYGLKIDDNSIISVNLTDNQMIYISNQVDFKNPNFYAAFRPEPAAPVAPATLLISLRNSYTNSNIIFKNQEAKNDFLKII